MKPALLIIDMQKYFHDENPAPFQEKLLPNIKQALNIVRSCEIPVVHIVTIYSRDRSDWPQAWKHLDEMKNK